MVKINSKRLLDLMLASGLGVREAAKAAGIQPSVLSVAIRYGRQCYFKTVAKLAALFGVSPHELILTETKGAN